VALSVLVYGQHAASMPVDIAIRIANSPRSYGCRARTTAAGEFVELLPGGVAYVDKARDIAFCSLDAVGFDAAAFYRGVVGGMPLGGAGPGRGHHLVPTSYPYAGLLRQVVRARALERMDPVSRACAGPWAPYEPVRGSHYWLYEDSAALHDAVDYIEAGLKPTTVPFVPGEHVGVEAVPLDGRLWQETFAAALATHDSAAPAVFTADIEYAIQFAVIRGGLQEAADGATGSADSSASTWPSTPSQRA
jgi:hypothetical protein